MAVGSGYHAEIGFATAGETREIHRDSSCSSPSVVTNDVRIPYDSFAGSQGLAKSQLSNAIGPIPAHGPHKLLPRPPARGKAKPAAPPPPAPSFRGSGAVPRFSAPSAGPSGAAGPSSSAARSAHRPAPRPSPRGPPHSPAARQLGVELGALRPKAVTKEVTIAKGVGTGVLKAKVQKADAAIKPRSVATAAATDAGRAASSRAGSAAVAVAEATDGSQTTGAPSVGFKEEEWQQQLALFAGDSGRREMVLTGKESRRYEQDIKRIAAQFRLH
ncbi:unnamed protein product, partial [Closterium sp. NIES-53]